MKEVNMLSAVLWSFNKILDWWRRKNDEQKRMGLLLINLKSEYSSNQRRGNPQIPFQLEWLTKMLQDGEIREECPKIFNKGLDIFQLAKDANIGKIYIRKFEKGVPLVPSHVQDLMAESIEDIDDYLSKK